MMQYPNLRTLAPDLIARIERAADGDDPAMLSAIDVEVRAFVATLVRRAVLVNGTVAEPTVPLAELSELYRSLIARCELRRDALKKSIGAQRRAHAAVTAYRSSGSVSLNA